MAYKPKTATATMPAEGTGREYSQLDSNEDTPVKTARFKRRLASAGTIYDIVMLKAGLCAGIALCVFAWGVGGYFTLEWVRSLGAPITIFGGSTIITMWWIIPISITAIEVGLDPDRIRSRWTYGIWIVVLVIDAGTTSAGIVSVIDDKLAWHIAWLIGIEAGLILARYPEKFGRGLFSDLVK